MRRFVTSAASATLLAVALVGPASADPLNERTRYIELTCANERITTAVIGNSLAVNLRDVESGRVFIPRAVSFTDPETGQLVSFALAPKNQAGRPVVSCTHVSAEVGLVQAVLMPVPAS